MESKAELAAEAAQDNGWFMSDGEVYLKENLESFSTIEEACRSMGFREISTHEGVFIINPEQELFDDWSDAAELSEVMAKEEDGSGAWYLTSSSEQKFKDFESCCLELGLIIK